MNAKCGVLGLFNLLFCSFLSCSDGFEVEGENLNFNNGLFHVLEADSNNVINIKSYDDFCLLLQSMKKTYIDDNEYGLLVNKLDTKASQIVINKEGCTAWGEYAGIKDLEFRIVDYQTADKLGILAFKTYFVSICQAYYYLSLESNWRPGVAVSPECGLLLDDPRNDEFVLKPRGYRAIYDDKASMFRMYTDIVYFLDYSNDPKIWFPCAPEKIKWNINLLVF